MTWGRVWFSGCLMLSVALAVSSLSSQKMRKDLAIARADLADARAEIVGLAEWSRVQAREVVAARAAAALDMELQLGDGADAPLSDYMLRGAGRVWGR